MHISQNYIKDDENSKNLYELPSIIGRKVLKQSIDKDHPEYSHTDSSHEKVQANETT